jgi:hypothetical protein
VVVEREPRDAKGQVSLDKLHELKDLVVLSVQGFHADAEACRGKVASPVVDAADHHPIPDVFRAGRFQDGHGSGDGACKRTSLRQWAEDERCTIREVPVLPEQEANNNKRLEKMNKMRKTDRSIPEAAEKFANVNLNPSFAVSTLKFQHLKCVQVGNKCVKTYQWPIEQLGIRCSLLFEDPRFCTGCMNIKIARILITRSLTSFL